MFKPLQKKLLKSRFLQRIFTFLITRYIAFVYASNRWSFEYDKSVKPYLNGEKQAIFAFWHGRLMMMPKFAPEGKKLYVMISIHNDGEIIANCMEYFNLGLVRGSSRKGGTAALRQARRVLLEKNQSLAITPDGPKGPRMHVNSHIIALAKITHIPIIPVTFSASRAKIMKSWDRFMVALPFGKSVFKCGLPFFIPATCDKLQMATLKEELEKVMVAITTEADRHVGRKAVEPAAKVL